MTSKLCGFLGGHAKQYLIYYKKKGLKFLHFQQFKGTWA